LVAAARVDVAAVADRIDRGERILRTRLTAPDRLEQQDRALGAALTEIADRDVTAGGWSHGRRLVRHVSDESAIR
jgi:hypothetical protein